MDDMTDTDLNPEPDEWIDAFVNRRLADDVVQPKDDPERPPANDDPWPASRTR